MYINVLLFKNKLTILITICILKFSNASEHRFGFKSDLYWPNDHSTLSDIIGEFFVSTEFKGEYSTFNQIDKWNTSLNTFNSFC